MNYQCNTKRLLVVRQILLIDKIRLPLHNRKPGLKVFHDMRYNF